jgi:hypothetical protein
MRYSLFTLKWSLLIHFVSAIPHTPFGGFETVKRDASSSTNSALQVDLGYSIYEGYNNATLDLNIWKG